MHILEGFCQVFILAKRIVFFTSPYGRIMQTQIISHFLLAITAFLYCTDSIIFPFRACTALPKDRQYFISFLIRHKILRCSIKAFFDMITRGKSLLINSG